LLLAGGILVTAPADALAQGTATVRLEENFRREPNGVVLARVRPGTTLQVLSTQGNWTEVLLEGSVWLRSLQVTQDPAFDLVVSAEGGENLRSGPSGTILARLEEGALLSELERDAAWARASRTGWIWSASLEHASSTDGSVSAGPVAPSVDTAAMSSGGAERPAARAPAGYVTVGGGGGPILTAPDGDTMAVATPASEVEVVRREGNWVRVRVEGWMWHPAGQQPNGGAVEEAPATAALDPAALRLAPEAHAGRVVQWDLQFISLERAEAVRTDFFQGEPFLLTRYGGSNGPFVYVAVPTDRLTEVDGLVPLERISVTGRIRTGASVLTSAPIIDLIGLERSREAP
jgi:hypothetical protein